MLHLIYVSNINLKVKFCDMIYHLKLFSYKFLIFENLKIEKYLLLLIFFKNQLVNNLKPSVYI